MAIANQSTGSRTSATRGNPERKKVVRRQRAALVRLWRYALPVVVPLAVSCSAGGGSSDLQPANASAAPSSRTAGAESRGSAGAPSSASAGGTPDANSATATTQRRTEEALEPLALAAAPDGGVSSVPPSTTTPAPNAAPDPASTPPADDDDDEEDDD